MKRVIDILACLWLISVFVWNLYMSLISTGSYYNIFALSNNLALGLIGWFFTLWLCIGFIGWSRFNLWLLKIGRKVL